MTITKEWFLDFWNLTPGTEEAEECWKAKQRLMNGYRGKAPMVFVQPDICYDSPIDGKPITSKHARIEDLARNNCQEYDPGMRQDYDRRVRESEAALEKSVEESIDREISAMPARKRELLQSELAAGADAAPVRL